MVLTFFVLPCDAVLPGQDPQFPLQGAVSTHGRRKRGGDLVGPD